MPWGAVRAKEIKVPFRVVPLDQQLVGNDTVIVQRAEVLGEIRVRVNVGSLFAGDEAEVRLVRANLEEGSDETLLVSDLARQLCFPTPVPGDGGQLGAAVVRQDRGAAQFVLTAGKEEPEPVFDETPTQRGLIDGVALVGSGPLGRPGNALELS